MSTSGLASVTVLALACVLLMAAGVVLVQYRQQAKAKRVLVRHHRGQPGKERVGRPFLTLGFSVMLGAMMGAVPQDTQAFAGWSAPAVVKLSFQAVDTASAASTAEEILSAPNHPDFLKLRNYLTRQLVRSEQFDQFPSPVLVDLSKHHEKETIKYLITQRPGVMSVIYYSQQQGHQLMLVYWPELSGEQVIYTPLSGFARRNTEVPLTSAQ
ncbi:hypothetical protein [Hahella ganghwensis]|uniref:hypothetical protein n=1 Tax=Hahella ganghwensis TaxID=286420 RepID=UPI00036AF72B|nr:hypothetical protein [Hahella ganghwensis]